MKGLSLTLKNVSQLVDPAYKNDEIIAYLYELLNNCSKILPGFLVKVVQLHCKDQNPIPKTFSPWFPYTFL